MYSMFMAIIGFDLFDYFFYILYRVTVGNQYRIFGLYYYQIFYFDGGDQVRFSIYIVVFSFVINYIVVVNVVFGGVGVDFL